MYVLYLLLAIAFQRVPVLFDISGVIQIDISSFCEGFPHLVYTIYSEYKILQHMMRQLPVEA